MARIIGLTGAGGSGKDSVANVLTEYDFNKYSMGDNLRKLVAQVNPWIPIDGTFRRYNDVVTEFGYTEAKRRYPAAFRGCLVDFGDGMRKVMGDDIWLDQVLPHHPGSLLASTKVVITDVRYPNEAVRIRHLGGQVWAVRRPGVGPANETERASLAQITPDLVIENSRTLHDLQLLVTDILQKR